MGGELNMFIFTGRLGFIVGKQSFSLIHREFVTLLRRVGAQ
jgi:hypothetical protein